MYQLSQFTVVHDLADRGLPGQRLVFDNLSGRSLVVRRESWESILRALGDPEAAAPPVRAAIERLAGMAILVARGSDERERWLRHFDAQRYGRTSIFPILAVTTGCNIGCTYCYESGTRSQTMSPAVVAGVLRWLERRVEGGVRELGPALFGGEPLLYPEILFALMDGTAALCRRHGAAFSFSASSNGTRLTDELAADLARRGLVQLQISLDGPEATHDRRRMGKRGEPSYREALRGIRIAVRHVANVTLKVNFDRHNRATIAALFDELAAEGLARALDVKLEAIAHQLPGSTVVHDPEHVIPPESVELAEAYHELTLEAQARGFTVRRDTAHTTPCMFSSDHGVLIGPDGSIYKCISLVGRTEFRVGSVLEDDYAAAEYARQMDVDARLDPCFEERCPYVPVCAGGCAYESIARVGSYGRFCTRDNLAVYHRNRRLIEHRARLEALGMRPLGPDELRSARSPRAPAAAAPRASSLVQLRIRPEPSTASGVSGA